MEIIWGNEQIDRITDGLYEKYRFEMGSFPCAELMTREAFGAYLNRNTEGCVWVSAWEDGRCAGVLGYSVREEEDGSVCRVPVFGLLGKTEQALSRLFQAAADRETQKGPCTFSVRLYAGDDRAIRLFSMLQFCMMSEFCIGEIGSTEADAEENDTVRTLTKPEIRESWGTVWGMTRAIIDHLQHSPVFYPGAEFTEKVYRDFYLDEETALHAAYDGMGQCIGIIETNGEEDRFAFPGGKSVNVGEIYVLPAYRKTGAAERLLKYAQRYERQRGARFMWVEHGTANPNARYFWDRYFTPYQYCMVRKIEPVR